MVQKLKGTITLPLSDEERTRIQAFLAEYRDVFAIHEFDCGLFKDFVCDVSLINENVGPIADKLRRYPLEITKLIQHLDKMEKAGIIKNGLPVVFQCTFGFASL